MSSAIVVFGRIALALSALVAASCSSPRDLPTEGVRRAQTTIAAAAKTPAVVGDRDRGQALVLKFECNRCHDGTGQPALATERHCVHCHEDIATGRFGAGTPKIAEWRRSVGPYRHAPSLDHAGERLRAEWIAAFLQNPFDVRPNLAATMPRLDIDAAQAADLAAYLTRDRTEKETSTLVDASLDRGRALMEAKGCGGCHVFTGVPDLPAHPDPKSEEPRRKAQELAPDLRFTRDRFRADKLAAWLLAPESIKPFTSMPNHSLTRAEASDIARYLLEARLAPPVERAPVVRLPLLSRKVSYHEVEERVLSVTCRHCHGDPDIAGGDGGPGNTGGFGFPTRGLDLSTYGSALAGLVMDDGERHSLFAPTKDGTPLLVAALLARQREETGHATPEIRGMPLGLPSVGAEEVQLVESWIAQGRQR